MWFGGEGENAIGKTHRFLPDGLRCYRLSLRDEIQLSKILKRRKMETRRRLIIISCFLKYQHLFLVDGNVGGREAAAAAAVPAERLPGD